MVSPQSFTIADVGCDHAYVSIALMNRAIAKKVIAMDVRNGPLDIARKNITEAGYTKDIDIRLGDGLEKLLPGEADAIIIAGMGGLLMKGILERGCDVLSCEKKRPILILQPQSDLREIRMFLHSHAYHIVCETMLVEDGKYYTVMKAMPTESDFLCKSNIKDMESVLSLTEKYSAEEWEYGKYNLINQSQVLLEYLKNEQRVLQNIKEKVETAMQTGNGEVPESTMQRLKAVKLELEINQKALHYFCEEKKI